jgi:transposase
MVQWPSGSSNGKLKLVKRQMHGRAKLDLIEYASGKVRR